MTRVRYPTCFVIEKEVGFWLGEGYREAGSK